MLFDREEGVGEGRGKVLFGREEGEGERRGKVLFDKVRKKMLH